MSTTIENCRAIESLALKFDLWLSSQLDKPAFHLHGVDRVNDIDQSAIQSLCDQIPALLTHHGQQATFSAGQYFVDAKIATDRPWAVERLERFGFSVVDVSLTLEKKCDDSICADLIAPSSGNANVTSFGLPWEDQIESLSQIAKESFRFSRFHLDGNISNPVAANLKADWIANTCRGQRGDRLFVSFDDGQATGFLSSLEVLEPLKSDESLEHESIQPSEQHRNSNRVAIIDLIAVANEHQGKAIGKQLSDAFIEYYQSRVELLRVGTQIANHPAIRLYQSRGFKPVASSYVLHHHRN